MSNKDKGFINGVPIGRLVQVLREKPEILARISDSTLSKLLSLHYINGFGWEQTADLMYYSIRDIYRKRVNALYALEKVLREHDKPKQGGKPNE